MAVEQAVTKGTGSNRKKRISDWNQEYRLRINLRQYGTACLGRIFQYTKLKDTTQYSS